MEKPVSLAMVFPGQGSQSQGMQAELATEYPEIRETYAEASTILGYDLWDLIQVGPAERLAETTVTQPAMLAAGYATYRAWCQAGGQPPTELAGHSLGEYTALVCAGALGFKEAIGVVEHRAELMQKAVPLGAGAMAAILGLDDERVIQLCAEVSETGIVEAANFNAPGQVVIAGQLAAVNRAIEAAKAAGARRAVPLPVSVPAHSSLMREASVKLAEKLAGIDFKPPEPAVICAADATAYVDAEDIRQRLAAQLYSPVQWVRTVNAMIESGARHIVECGPGRVLSGLVRRIDKTLTVSSLEAPTGITDALAK